MPQELKLKPLVPQLFVFREPHGRINKKKIVTQTVQGNFLKPEKQSLAQKCASVTPPDSNLVVNDISEQLKTPMVVASVDFP